MSSLAVLTYICSDVYIFLMFIVTAIVPVWLYLWQRKVKFGPVLWIILAGSGLVAGYCNFFRSQSGTGIILFLVFWIFLNFQWPLRQKFLSFALLIIFFLAPYWHFHHLVKQRDGFLTDKVSNYQGAPSSHPFWHSIYIG